MTRIIFMGTPDFSVSTLKVLIAKHDVAGVITQPDRPAGRSLEPRPSPVKRVALEHGIPVFQPEKLRKKQTIEELKSWQGEAPDLYVVAAFGQILPQEVLDLPRRGSINVHASLLPRWRGAAPIQAAIRTGDAESGITIMLMDAGLDTGPMLSKAAVPILPQETGASLHDKLANLGAQLLIDTLPGYLSGKIQPQMQDESLVTFAPQITKDEGRIDWSQSAAEIERLVRAFTPWPGTYTFWKGSQLKILAGSAGPGQLESGMVWRMGDKITVGTGDGLYFPHRLQLEGKKSLEIADFVNGYAEFIGSVLG